MKRALSSTRWTASSMSRLMSAYWARRSRSGTCIADLTGIAFMMSSVVDPALVLEPLLHRDLAPRLGPASSHDGAGRDVAGHHRAGRHQTVLADLDAWKQHRPGADASAASNGDALEMLEALRGAAHEVVVRGD